MTNEEAITAIGEARRVLEARKAELVAELARVNEALGIPKPEPHRGQALQYLQGQSLGIAGQLGQ